ncbi:electron transfer flavoprotein subunit alpha/FixB family protein [Marinobacter sp. ELB17]|uniref:electron transfer flavoprotein subunit alpha/FixB family protein n=1 Tax=Marinobacter sp. ELB17 TaxID=270374 RepID=UPI0000F39AFA|nr:electron transfer flavoprotein subunit alpha/FixB family protein [Marinobacter sp. ELB17]EAZ99749.1 Electron transfer flavoprotein, alpha subunit [Marinobacter sp. ELB17]
MHNGTDPLPRRDSRKERIARNRLHPEHDAVLAEMLGTSRVGPSLWAGPNGLARRNPHRVGFSGPNGIKRIDRSGAQIDTSLNLRTERQAVVADRRTTVEIETPAFLIAVVPDLPGGRLSAHDRDLLGLARQLADADPAVPGAVLAIVFGAIREDGFGTAGVDRLLHSLIHSADQSPGLGASSNTQCRPEARLAVLADVERELLPCHWLLPDSPMGGADLGRRLAARLSERPATQVWQINQDADGKRCNGLGAAGSTDINRPLSRLVLALAECAEPVAMTRHAARPMTLPAPLSRMPGRIQDLGAVAVDPATVALDEAEFILAAGRGVSDWAGFHNAAAVLGATEGASRVAVDDGFMARDRQVGASGTWVTARVYLAVGISGAIQHLQGIKSCDKVVSINLDPDCDMNKRADLAVIGDADEILAALVALQQRIEEKADAA